MKHSNLIKNREASFKKKRFAGIGLALLLSLCLSCPTSHAQQTLDAAGGEATGSGGSASYSVGQMFYHTHTGTNEYSVAEGVQQPFEISVVTGIDDASDIMLECSVYPNPTRDVLSLKVENYMSERLTYQLFDMSGELLESKKLTGDKTIISMSGYVRATYFLKIVDDKKKIKVFKIIKL